VTALVVGVASFTAIGVAMSTLIPNQESGGPVTSIVFFVLLFLSGLWYPIPTNSGLAKVSSFFPLRHMILAVYAPFHVGGSASGWDWRDLWVVAVWGVGGVYVSLRRWKWAPRPSRSGARNVRVGRLGRRSG
jgi:ABC-2 type transport system permease protein